MHRFRPRHVAGGASPPRSDPGGPRRASGRRWRAAPAFTEAGRQPMSRPLKHLPMADWPAADRKRARPHRARRRSGQGLGSCRRLWRELAPIDRRYQAVRGSMDNCASSRPPTASRLSSASTRSTISSALSLYEHLRPSSVGLYCKARGQAERCRKFCRMERAICSLKSESSFCQRFTISLPRR